MRARRQSASGSAFFTAYKPCMCFFAAAAAGGMWRAQIEKWLART
jgi:hypothetical protein